MDHAGCLRTGSRGIVRLREHDTTTDSRHLGGTIVEARTESGDVGGLDPRLDGNNVQLDRELIALGRAGGDFNAAQTILAAKFRLVRYAINEGR